MSTKGCCKMSMPSTGSLLLTIACFGETTYMIRTTRIRKTRRLSYINLLLQYAMKKSILPIKLTKKPTSSNCKREKKPDGGRLNHRTEGVFVVKTIALSKPYGNKTRFVVLNRPIKMLLHLENPF